MKEFPKWQWEWLSRYRNTEIRELQTERVVHSIIQCTALLWCMENSKPLSFYC